MLFIWQRCDCGPRSALLVTWVLIAARHCVTLCALMVACAVPLAGAPVPRDIMGDTVKAVSFITQQCYEFMR